MPDRCDVLVVGAGPAGSASAALLARLGYHVILIDRARFPRAKACAEYLSPGVVRLLHRLDLDGFFTHACPQTVPGMDILSRGGGTLRIEYRREGERLMACTLPRRTLDSGLLSEAGKSGAEVREGCAARAPLMVDHAVSGMQVQTREHAGEIRAPLTIIADGCRSPFASALGLARPARWPRRLGLVAHFRGQARLNDGFGQMHVDRDGYVGIAPLPDGNINVALVTRQDAVRRSSLSATDYLHAWIAAKPSLQRTLDGCERVSSVRGIAPIGSRSRSAATHGALLVGDAASFFDPFTGEGIFRALHGAELAVEVAHLALRNGTVSASTLAPYDRLRAIAFRRKEAVTGLVQLFVQFPGLMEYAIPRLARREGPLSTLSLVLGDV